MTSCFVTHQGTLLCFGGEDDFCHVALDRLDEASLVVADADPDALRAGGLLGRTVTLRPRAGLRSGLPRSLAVGATGEAATVSLGWQDRFLCAGTQGENVHLSDRVEAWEEFLPIPADDIALMRDLAAGGWEIGRGGRLEPGQVGLRPAFELRLGALSVHLRQHSTLGGPDARASGRAIVLVDGWRVERLRRFEPLVVWRHDGSDGADEEIVLGLRSMVAHARHDGAVHVETRLGRDELVARCGVDPERVRIGRPPECGTGLLPWNRDLEPDEVASGPILLLGNGVTCHRDLDPLLRGLAETDAVALLPWIWTDGDPAPAAGQLFGTDGEEGPDGRACSGDVVGLPDLRRASVLHRLIDGIRMGGHVPGPDEDGFEDALLGYVIRRAGGGSTALLSRHVTTVSAPGRFEQAGRYPTLVNHRRLPSAIRAGAMRTTLGLTG